MRPYGKPAIRLSIPAPPRPRERGATGGDSPPGSPVDMHSVKGILREYDRGAYGEAFRGDRLAKIAVLGKGELHSFLIESLSSQGYFFYQILIFVGCVRAARSMYDVSIFGTRLVTAPREARDRPGRVFLRSSVCSGLVWPGPV